jgi:Putative cyclase
VRGAIERGDTVLIRTGWGRYFTENPALYKGDASPGPSVDGAQYLVKQRVFAVGNDTLTFEMRPPIVTAPVFQVFPVHMLLIADNGIHIIENFDLEERGAPAVWRVSADSFDDPDVPLRGVAELFERGLIARAVVRRGGLGDAVELDHDHALGEPGLVGLRWHTAHEEAAAPGLDGGRRELRIRGQRVGILDGVIARDPVRLRHDTLRVVIS